MEATAQQPVQMDDDEALVLLADFGNEIYMAKSRSAEVVWSRLSSEERVMLQEAKKEACMIFADNAAWKPIPKGDCEASLSSPMCSLL